jgi:hypothetical protein
MGVCARLILLACVVAGCSAPGLETTAGDVHAATPDSTFYDFYLPYYRRVEPSSVFASERAELRSLNEGQVAAFDWSPLGKEPALFNETQTLRFLLPWIADSSHSSLASSWLLSWYNAHCLDESKRLRWGSALAAAQRALVLAYWLEQETRRGESDQGIVAMLQDALRMHREFLSSEDNFDDTMNAGVLQAIALRECARATRVPDGMRLATGRLLTTLKTIISPSGASLEHSAQYHFIVLAWTDAALSMYRNGGDASTARLAGYVERMRRAGYFLLDRNDRLVQIGDSDSTVVPGFSAAVTKRLDETHAVFFDTLAGYAIYKPAASSSDGRYVVYRIQSGAILHEAHAHADAMSLVASWNGETILGDSGRYSYAGDGLYFSSHPAHNSIFPESFLRTSSNRQLSAVANAVEVHDGNAVSWWAWMDWHGVKASRRVSIPPATQAVVVSDTLRRDESARHASRYCWTWNAGYDVREATLDSRDAREAVWTVVSHGGHRFRFRMTVAGAADGVQFELRRGERHPELGWTSPSYGVRNPSWVLLARVNPGALTTVRTVIEPLHAP